MSSKSTLGWIYSDFSSPSFVPHHARLSITEQRARNEPRNGLAQKAGQRMAPHEKDRHGLKPHGAGAHQLLHQLMPNTRNMTLIAQCHQRKNRGEAGEASLTQTEPNRNSSFPQPSPAGLAPSADIWVAQGWALLLHGHQSRAMEAGACPATHIPVPVLLLDPALSSASTPAITFHDGASGMCSLPAAHTWHL